MVTNSSNSSNNRAMPRSPSSRSPDRSRRRSRWERAADPPPMRMTEQRVHLLEAVWQHRVLSRDQLQRVGGYASRNTVNYALGLLYHHGYLARRFVPPVVAAPGQDHQALYLLDRKGAAVLAARRGLSGWRELGWKPADNDISWWHLPHLVACNDLLVAFAGAAQQAGCQFAWLSEQELRRRARQGKVEIQLPDGRRKRMAAVADAFLEITPARGQKLAFFLECDRGTVDVGQRWQAKILAYEAFLHSPLYAHCFPLGPHTVGVLTVTTSPARLRHLKAASESVSGAGFFLFTTFADATADQLLSEPIWHIVHRPHRYPLLAQGGNRPASPPAPSGP